MAFATPAFSHATLVATQPPDGAVVDAPPEQLVLTFNEPTSPTVLRLTRPDGTATELTDYRREGNSVIVALPADLGDGTHIMSWRVVSEDEHPIGSAFLFSVRIVTDTAGSAPAASDPILRIGIWAARVAIYLGLFIGAAGAFFAAWIAAPAALPAPARRIIRGFAIGGIIALPLAFLFQGVDLIGGGIGDVLSGAAVRAAFGSAYSATLAFAGVALAIGLLTTTATRRKAPRRISAATTGIARLTQPSVARLLTAAGLLATGIAFSLSGHASKAPPEALTWLVVMVHTTAVAFWIGSLVPLGFLLRDSGRAGLDALVRFSAVIPHAIVPMLVAGVLLIVVQVTAFSDLWATAYGRVLAAKLLLVAALLILAMVNRYRLTPLAKAKPSEGARALRRAIVAEVAIVMIVFGVVALWRFTPPPRSLAAAEASTAPGDRFFTHIHAPGVAAANVTLDPGRLGPVSVLVELMTEAFEPLAAQELRVSLRNAAAGIEPIVREAVLQPDGKWRAEGFVLTVPGTWNIGLEARVSAFDQRSIAGAVRILDADEQAVAAERPAQSFFTHFHIVDFGANIDVVPGVPGPTSVVVELMDGAYLPLSAQALTVSLANETAGIGAIERTATRRDDGKWVADGFDIAVPGVWALGLAATVSDNDIRTVVGPVVIADPNAVAGADGHDHEHAVGPAVDVNDPNQVVVLDAAEAPTIAMDLRQADNGAWHLSFAVERFRFGTPEDGFVHVPGVGHGHVLVNGQYVGDLAGPTYSLTLPAADGVYEIYVGLSALDHRSLVVEGELVSSRTVILVEDRARIGDERTVLEVPIAIGPEAPTLRVRQGETVELRLTSATPEVVHLHGYDMEVGIGPRSPVTLLFNAAFAGRFVAEAHDANETTVFYLEVMP